MLIKHSNLWLLDNPLKTLEVQHRKQLITTLKYYKNKASIIIATQDPKILTVADKVLWLEQGKVKYFGNREQLNPELNKGAA
ncbi:MAG: hypothetical protein AB8G05_23295 [Oligoflexales bacterium]